MLNNYSDGGAIALYNNSHIETIDDTKFTGNGQNTYFTSGGAITLNNSSIGTIKNSEFINNVAQTGAAMFLSGNSSIGTIKNTTFEYNDNSLGSFTGIIALRDTSNIGEIKNSVFTNKTNITTSNGGVFNIENDASIDKISTAEFDGFKSYNGGVIYLRDNGRIGEIDNAKFTNNTSNGQGGAITLLDAVYQTSSASIGNITNSTFENNKANLGAAIYVGSKNSIGDIDNCVFKDNIGTGTGGSTIYLQNNTSAGNISNTLFEGNTNNNAIYLGDNSTIKDLTNVIIRNNTATNGGGGAITLNSQNTMGNITNSTFENNKGGVGAIRVGYDGVIGDITNCVFKNNSVTNNYGNGGAIFLNARNTVGHISDTIFEGNTSGKLGGAIYIDNGTINGLDNVLFKDNNAQTGGGIFINYSKNVGDWNNVFFENNHATGQGGAVYNSSSTIGNWDGGHIYGVNEDVLQQGAGIWNNRTIGNLSNIEIKDTHVSQSGGAIFNVGEMGNLTNISITNATAIQQGAGIFNSSKMGDLTNVTFEKVGVVKGQQSLFTGGAIMNTGTMGNWNGGFIHGLGEEGKKVSAGAGLFNSSTFGDINNVEFKDLYATNNGAAISNNSSGIIGTISNSSFINNHVTSNPDDVGYNPYFGQGGAINNAARLKGIENCYFENNSAIRAGGAINDNSSQKYSITNSVFKDNKSGDGGAIWSGTIDVLSGSTFINNQAIGLKGPNDTYQSGMHGRGGAVYYGIYYGDKLNLGEGNNLFQDNYARQGGGAIWAEHGISVINNSSFVNNKSDELGGAILVWNKTIDGIKNSSFVNNTTGYLIPEENDRDITMAYGSGGAIWINEKLGDIENSYFADNKTITKFDNQYDKFGQGGAIYAPHSIGNIINTTFKNNSAGNSGGAIWTSGSIDKVVNSLFMDNKANTSGGAIMHYGFNFDTGENYKAAFENTSFINNTAEKGRGGAIYSTGDLDIVADNNTVTFSGNKDSKGDNDIYLDTTTGINVNVSAKNNADIEFHGGIDASHEYDLKINGDNSSRVLIDNDIKMANMVIENTNVYSYTPAFITSNPSVSVNSGTLNFAKLYNQDYHFNNLSNTGTINMQSVDIDVAAEKMGRISADNYGDMSGTINVNSLNILSDPIKDKTNVHFADQAFAQSVQYHGTKEYYTPIYKYGVSYLPDSGEFQFIRGAGSSAGGADYYNPAVLAAPVNVQSGAKATLNESFKYVFEHADAFTQLPSMERLSKIEANKYAISTDFNNNMFNSGSLSVENNRAVWTRPYSTFESINLKHGPKVNAVTYGTLIGYDGDFKEMRNGWHRLGTSYIGYNGSQLSYGGSDTSMNGGLLGATETFYKGNFWTALTLSAGASVGETRTMYGKEDFTSLLAGIGSKTGYNFEFKDGKYILQPIMFMSYTFVNTFDYTNAAGVKINSDPAHSIQLNPSVRFTANLKHGWQPYASVGMVWNVMNENKVTANSVRLPEMGLKPYVEYGVGVQRNWKDRFTAFCQAMIRNGGRNGIALTAGFRWALGREGKPIEKVQGVNEKVSQQTAPKVVQQTNNKLNIMNREDVVSRANNGSFTNNDRKIVKQLTSAQKTALGAKYSNTTRTTNVAILKSL